MFYKEDKEEDYRLYYGSKHFMFYNYNVQADELDCTFNECDTGVYINLDKDSNILHCNLNYEVAAFFGGADYKFLKSPIMIELVRDSVVEIELTKQYVEYKKLDDFILSM